jgi:preprotein translocase SecE subunit
MAIKEDIKREETGGPEGADPAEPHAESPEPEAPLAGTDEQSAPIDDGGQDDADDEVRDVASPQQLGTQRFVYAAYFAGAIGIAFIMSKALDFGWYKAQSYRPSLGEPREEIVMPLAALIGAGAAVYYWVRTRARELAEQVAAEMSKVTWPNRTEVTNGTVVVIVTTLVSTVFFALMDRFWGFVSNLVYGGT